MYPNAVHDPERKHDHERERSAVTDQRQWHTGDRQHRDGHADVLEDVSEDEGGDPNDEEQTKLITGKKSDKKTGQKQKGKCADEKRAADKPPLLSDCRKNVIVVDRGCGQKAELDLGVGRFKALTGPAAGANGNERLIDRPRRSLLIDVRINESGDA